MGKGARRSLDEVQRIIESELPHLVERAGKGDTLDPVRLDCPPRGHGLLSVRLSVDHNWHPILDVVQEDDRLPRGRRAAKSGVPGGVRRTVCAEPGCPTLTNPDVDPDYCAEHSADGKGWISLNEAKLELDCRRCPYHGPAWTADLLLLVAAATEAGLRSIRPEHY